jgi:hypothetical protein
MSRKYSEFMPSAQDVMRPIHVQLKAYRILHNLTQKQVADYLQINQSDYSRKENGEALLTFAELKQLGELYKLK